MNKVEQVYYSSLCETAAALTSTHSSSEILNNLVGRVAKTLNAKACALIMCSSDKKHLFNAAAYGLSKRHTKNGPILSEKAVHDALEGKVVAIAKASEDEIPQCREEAEREGIASILSIPMKLKDKVIGVLRVYTAEPYQFNDDDIYFVDAVAKLGAIALNNARFYQSIQKSNQKVKKELLQFTNYLNS